MSEEGTWRTVKGRRVFIKKGQSLREAMSESGKFDKEKLQERLKRRLGKVSSETAGEEWKKLTKSDIIELNNNEEIVNYFKEKHNIELSNLDKLKPEEIKPALCGVDDFLRDFPEARRGLKKIEYVPGLRKAYGTMDTNKLMQIRKDGFADYGTGVHETSHALDFGKSSIFDKEKYSEKIVRQVLKEKGIKRKSKEYNKLLDSKWIPVNYPPKDYELELFAHCIEEYYTNKNRDEINKNIITKLKEGE